MIDKIQQMLAEIESEKAESTDQVESLRVKYLGRKGKVKALFSEFKNVPSEKRKEIGQKLNELQNKAKSKVEDLKQSLKRSSGKSSEETPDLTRPAGPVPVGTRHPVSIIRQEIIDIFSRIGFTVSEGPEIEDDWHNFTALNFPPEHPARDMQDTFFIRKAEDSSDRSEEVALRTHTSSVQVRVMENSEPPLRTISPGRVYRNEAISARAHCFFHQVEGLYIDTDVSFADLKQTLLYFAKEMFGEATQIRLRPSYFPFTEPSAEVDISCSICGGDGCGVCKYTGWVEILGCGMVDPNVLENCGIDPNKYSGFAFGMGVERIAQLKYRVNDLRLYSENDVRFLDQFKAAF